MSEPDSERIILLLESINSKLDSLSRIEHMLDLMKMDISGFEHEGRQYEGFCDKAIGSLEELNTAAVGIQSGLSDINMTMSQIESNTAQ